MPAKKQSSKRSVNNQQLITALIVLVLLVVAAILAEREQPAPPAPPTVTPGQSPGALPAWLNVYFTNPNPPDNLNGGIDQRVVPALNAATQSIDLATLDLNLPSVVNALAAARQRGVNVRVVVDGENGVQDLEAARSPGGKAYKALTVLKNAGIQVVDGGRSNGLMHDKMIIVDGRLLFVGSWNMSYNDTFRNNNNLLQVSAPALVANYQAKFNELFVDKRFGARAKVGAKTPSASIDGVAVENYFSPVDGVMRKLIQRVSSAKRSVHFIIFTYTDKDLAAAMIERAGAGVDVRGVIENRGASQGALVPLSCAKLAVKVDGNKYTMHHKVIIIDGEIVITGSFNFTRSADTSNDDNILIFHSPSVAALYEQEFARIDAAAQPPGAVDCSNTN